ncbi:hypothetical protein RIF29_33829 [Crotalaria pallida]|uniref:Uncharacterized protein n=1 Tax=Crotalaria pallida TaxID=3830 RepID=A0AAN9HUA4_CROPI
MPSWLILHAVSSVRRSSLSSIRVWWFLSHTWYGGSSVGGVESLLADTVIGFKMTSKRKQSSSIEIEDDDKTSKSRTNTEQKDGKNGCWREPWTDDGFWVMVDAVLEEKEVEGGS